MTSPWSYDSIAEVYATDMGASMAFDDVGFYRDVCARQNGPALELGCGTGRILLPLLASGLDIAGADRSLPMLARLRRDAAARGLPVPRVAQMDLRAPALRGAFATILAPYSLITYLPEPADVDAFLSAARGLLEQKGILVLDAFVPKDVAPFDDFRLDYRRPHADGFLERHKRIACLPDGTNRIERRYRLRDKEWTTVERIRPYAAAALEQALARNGLAVREIVHDYGAGSATPPQFATLIASR